MSRVYKDALIAFALFGAVAGGVCLALGGVAEGARWKTVVLALTLGIAAAAGFLLEVRRTRRILSRLVAAVRGLPEPRQAAEFEAALNRLGASTEIVELARALARAANEGRDVEADKERNRPDVESAARLQSVGRLAGGVAHGFNNLMTAILQSREAAETALDSGEVEDVRNLLMDIETEVARGNDLTHQLLAFARQHPSSPRVLDVNEVAGRTVTALRHALPAGLELITEVATEPLPTRFDQRQLEQVLSNLVAFCRDSMRGAGSRIHVRTCVVELTSESLPSEPELVSGRVCTDRGVRRWSRASARVARARL